MKCNSLLSNFTFFGIIYYSETDILSKGNSSLLHKKLRFLPEFCEIKTNRIMNKPDINQLYPPKKRTPRRFHKNHLELIEETEKLKTIENIFTSNSAHMAENFANSENSENSVNSAIPENQFQEDWKQAVKELAFALVSPNPNPLSQVGLTNETISTAGVEKETTAEFVRINESFVEIHPSLLEQKDTADLINLLKKTAKQEKALPVIRAFIVAELVERAKKLKKGFTLRQILHELSDLTEISYTTLFYSYQLCLILGEELQHDLLNSTDLPSWNQFKILLKSRNPLEAYRLWKQNPDIFKEIFKNIGNNKLQSTETIEIKQPDKFGFSEVRLVFEKHFSPELTPQMTFLPAAYDFRTFIENKLDNEFKTTGKQITENQIAEKNQTIEPTEENSGNPPEIENENHKIKLSVAEQKLKKMLAKTPDTVIVVLKIDARFFCPVKLKQILEKYETLEEFIIEQVNNYVS